MAKETYDSYFKNLANNLTVVERNIKDLNIILNKTDDHKQTKYALRLSGNQVTLTDETYQAVKLVLTTQLVKMRELENKLLQELEAVKMVSDKVVMQEGVFACHQLP